MGTSGRRVWLKGEKLRKSKVRKEVKGIFFFIAQLLSVFKMPAPLLTSSDLSSLLIFEKLCDDWVREVHKFNSERKKKKNFVIFRNCDNKKLTSLEDLKEELEDASFLANAEFKSAFCHDIVSNKVGANKIARKAAKAWMADPKKPITKPKLVNAEAKIAETATTKASTVVAAESAASEAEAVAAEATKAVAAEAAAVEAAAAEAAAAEVVAAAEVAAAAEAAAAADAAEAVIIEAATPEAAIVVEATA